jgi:PKD repeat protein
MIRKLGTILLVLVLLLSVGAYTVAAGSPPVADANGPYSGFVGQPTQLDGSGSSDPDGDIVLYEWDFDGDGTYDYSSATNPITTHTYLIAKLYTARLRVTDAEGGEDIADAVVIIAHPQPELWAVEYRYAAPPPGYEWAGAILKSWMEVRIENRGSGDAFNVTASVISWPANVDSVPDADVTIGNIPAGGSAWSGDAFTIWVDTDVTGVDPCEGIFWRVEYDDVTGAHHVVENVPEFPTGEGPCDEEEPPVEVGGAVYPVNQFAMLAPWLALAAVSIVGTTIAIRRRRAIG